MQKIFIANFGIGNSLWTSCLEASSIATYCDEDASWEAWLAGDRGLFIATAMDEAALRQKAIVKSVASRWFNLLDLARDTAGDIWIHREKDELWWTTSTAAPPRKSKITAPWSNPNTPHIHLLEKPTEPWRNTSSKGTLLLWNGLHPRARQFLFTEATFQRLRADNTLYADALISGRDLTTWHDRVEWRALVAQRGHGEVRIHDVWSRVARRMADTAQDTTLASCGGPRSQNPKRKEFQFRDVHDLSSYLTDLLREQGYACAITGLPLHDDDDTEDPELRASLDRIDSDKHYERTNLQVVCKFVNRWKLDDTDDNFRRLIDMVRS